MASLGQTPKHVSVKAQIPCIWGLQDLLSRLLYGLAEFDNSSSSKARLERVQAGENEHSYASCTSLLKPQTLWQGLLQVITLATVVGQLVDTPVEGI